MLKYQSFSFRGIMAILLAFGLVILLCASPHDKTHAQPESQSILVDASRDGGLWWFPQAGPFDPNEPHQGKALADYLRSLGHTVTELPRPTTITSDLLALHDLIIRAGSVGGYSVLELTAYQSYVNSGGRLLLLSDKVLPGQQDSLGLAFGITFEGISRGENVVDSFAIHPITESVSPLAYGVGSGITSYPETANILGYLSEGTYLDLNDNGLQDPGEPTAAPVLGEMSYGNGKIIFAGDTNMWQWLPQPLLDNTINWLTALSPKLTINYSNGSPGSFFILTGSDFTENSIATININGQALGTIPSDTEGSFTFLLSTTNADEGSYFVTTSLNSSATTRFVLDSNDPTRPQEGSGTVFDVPAGIAFTESIFLPVILH